jgi:ABC-type transport system involved in multi-copper enzyme maturation permease subunit
MLTKMFLKEWKERIPFFLLEILLMAALVVLRLMKNDLLFNYMTGMILIFFIPFAALLIGSSAFHSEFKNDAWTYLFSRPIKKWAIWLVKFTAQLTVLATIFLLFMALLEVLPGLKDVVESYGFTTGRGNFSIFSTSFFVSTALFVVAFSISFLYEKQLILLLVTIVLGIGSAAFIEKCSELFQKLFVFDRSLKGLYFLWPLGFAAASIWTFTRADFSQAKEKIFFYIKSAVLCLILALAVSSVGTLGSMERSHYISQPQVSGGLAWFGASNGLYVFEPDKDRVVRIKKGHMSYGLSVSGDKMAFAEWIDAGESTYFKLWLINKDGTGEMMLADSKAANSPLSGLSLRTCRFSTDGRKIAFVATEGWGKRSLIGVVRPDGTGLKTYPLDLPNIGMISLAGWEAADRFILAFKTKLKDDPEFGSQLIRFDSETGAYETLTEISKRVKDIGLSPDRNRVSIVVTDTKSKSQTLNILDLRTLETAEIAKASFIDGSVWSDSGRRIFFVADQKDLKVYSISDRTVTHLKEIKFWRGVAAIQSLAWMPGEKGIIFADRIDDQGCLRMVDLSTGRERRLMAPISLKNINSVLCIDSVVIVLDFRRSRMWRVNQKTEEWKRIY